MEQYAGTDSGVQVEGASSSGSHDPDLIEPLPSAAALNRPVAGSGGENRSEHKVILVMLLQQQHCPIEITAI